MRKITKYILEKSTEHLYYETLMFYKTLEALTTSKNQLEINILLDAFAIHARNLFDFFYPKKNIKPDDMIVNDFIKNLGFYNKNKTKKRDLLFIVRKADKQVAHLTYARNRYNHKNKGWKYLEIGKKMKKTLDAFYESLSDSEKEWQNIKDLKKIIDQFRFE